MANIKVQYNGSTANYTAPLDTAGKLMASDLTITAEPVLQDKSVTSNGSITYDSGYDGLGTVTVAVPSDLNNTDLDVIQTSQVQNYQAPDGFSGIGSITVTAQTVNPAFDGGALSVSGAAAATGTNVSLSTDTNTGIVITAAGNATPARGSVLYNGAVAGWVSKSDNTVALASANGTSTALTSTTYYIESITLPADHSIEIDNKGDLAVYNNGGSMVVTTTDYDTIGHTYINTGAYAGYVHVDDQTVFEPSGLVTADPVLYGANLSVSGTGSASGTNASLSTTKNNSGISISAGGSATPNRTSVQYYGRISGWVSKSGGEVAMAQDTGTATALSSTTYYVDDITVPSGKTLTVDTLTGRLNVSAGAGSLYRTGKTGTTYINGTAAGDKVVVAGTSVSVDGTVVTDSNWDLLTANPTFNGGGITASGSATNTGGNVTLESTNNSGVSVSTGGSLAATRASVLYAAAVNGFVTKSSGATALAAASGLSVSIPTSTVYINNITVPSGKTLTVTTVNGVLNVNGGATNQGVQVKANKVAVVDGFTVTYGTTTVVNGITYSAGDLKVPTYNSSGTSLEYPDPGIFSSAAGTTTMSITGNVTKINNLTVKDVNAVTGSGTASSSYSNTYLAKWNSSTTLTTGPRVAISSTAPSNPSAGDIWYQI